MVLSEIFESSRVVRQLLCEDGVNRHSSFSVRIDKGVTAIATRELSEVAGVVVALMVVNGLHNYRDVAGAELYVVLVHEIRP